VSNTLHMNSTLKVDDHRLHHTTSELTLQSSLILRWEKELRDIDIQDLGYLLDSFKAWRILPPLHLPDKVERYSHLICQLFLGKIHIPTQFP
jgi:hypothetical protein